MMSRTAKWIVAIGAFLVAAALLAWLLFAQTDAGVHLDSGAL